jgi:hypothetical protein
MQSFWSIQKRIHFKNSCKITWNVIFDLLVYIIFYETPVLNHNFCCFQFTSYFGRKYLFCWFALTSSGRIIEWHRGPTGCVSGRWKWAPSHFSRRGAYMRHSSLIWYSFDCQLWLISTIHTNWMPHPALSKQQDDLSQPPLGDRNYWWRNSSAGNLSAQHIATTPPKSPISRQMQ